MVAGLAGLLRSQQPGWSTALVRSHIAHTAATITNTQLGGGRIDAAQAVLQAPRPLLNVVATFIDGDPLGRPTPGAGSSLTVRLNNDWLDATSITGVLTTTDPFVTIVTDTSSFGNLSAGSSGLGTPVYSFTVASAAGYNHPIGFVLNLTANAGVYTTTLPITITTRSSDQPFCGTIAQNLTWTNDKTYLINCNVGVAPGYTLTIQPGTVIKFTGNYNLNIGGTLIADGTPAQPIRFTSSSPAIWWGRVYFDDLSTDAIATADGTYQSGNILRWVKIENANEALGCNGATPYLAHVDMNWGGVLCTLGGTPLWLLDSTLTTDFLVTGAGQVHRTRISGALSFSGLTTVRDSSVGNGLATGANSLVQGNTLTGSVQASGSTIMRNNVVVGGNMVSGNGSVIADNTITGGSIAVGSFSTVMTNTLVGGGITVGDGSLVQANDAGRNSNGWGVSATDNVTVTGNRLVGNGGGVNMTGGRLVGNLIANSDTTGVQAGSVLIISNTVTNNKGTALLVDSGLPVIQGNNLEGNHGTYDLVNNTPNSITATNNWWGTIDPMVIDARTYDFMDDFNLGRVSYAPMLSNPVQSAPAYVRAISVTPAGPVGLETVNFDVSFSRPMDLSLNPQTTFRPVKKGAWDWYITANSGISSDFVCGASLVDRHGNVWVGIGRWWPDWNGNVNAMCSGPLNVRHTNGSWQVITMTSQGAGISAVNALAEDNDGNVLIGTGSNSSVVVDRENGDVWRGFMYGAVALQVTHPDGAVESYTTSNSGLPSNLVIALLLDQSTGDLWVGSWGGLSVRHADGTWDNYLSGYHITALARGLENDLWIGTYRQGAFHHHGSAWDHITANAAHGLGSNQVWDINVDVEGNVWFVSGRDAGINSVLRSTGIWERYDLGATWSVATDQIGSAWFSVEGAGLGVLGGGPDYLIAHDTQWTSPQQWHGTYDINGLVPRGVYAVGSQKAAGGDGLEIAPVWPVTFTVDYIGTPDPTIPLEPVVRACASNSSTTLSAQWTMPPTQTIGLYRYAIGTAPGKTDVTNWVTTTLTAITRTNLNLLPGQSYYVSVKARSTGGMWGNVGSSNGVVAGAGGCPQVNFVATPTEGMSPLAVSFTPQITGAVTTIQWSFGNDVTNTQLSPTVTYTVPGVYTVTLDVDGPGGWSTAIKPEYITIMPDTVPPVGSLTMNSGVPYVATTTVSLDIAASDPSGLNGMRLSNDGASYAEWIPYSPVISWGLAPGDGHKTVYAQVRDMPGNSATYTDTITLDTTPPTATVALLPPFSGNATFTVTWSGGDTLAGLADYDVQSREGSGGMWTDWLSGTTQIAASFTGADAQTYYFRTRARDRLGNLGAYVSGNGDTHTTLDLQPPLAAFTINDGAINTSDPNVTLRFTVTDTSGVSVFRASHDGVTYTNWLSYTSTYSWTLAPGLGEKTVVAQFQDIVGHESQPVTATITVVDTTPPSVTLDALPPYQTTSAFVVAWSGFDMQSTVESFDVQVRDGGDAWTDWLTSTTALSASFNGLDGHLYAFQARARDTFGNLSEFTPSAWTRVDTARPAGAIAINGGAHDTISPTVTLMLLANGADEMAFSNAGLIFGAYEPFAEQRPYQLPPGDSLKTVFVRYRDRAGNTADFSDTINLNTMLPGDVGLTIDDDAAVTEQITTTLTLKAPPGTHEMMISNSSRFVAAEWEPYAITRTWLLAYHPFVAVYQVYARFRGVDGSIGPRYDDLITLHLIEPPPPIDSMPPSGSVIINAGAEATEVPTVTLDVLAADNPGGLGVKWMYFREWKYDPVIVQWVTVRSSGWLPYSETSSTPWLLASGTGVKYVGAWFADGANNISNPVVLDSLNLIEPGDTIGQAQVTQYRRTFAAGQVVTVTLTVNNGDADVYIWRPGSLATPDYVSNRPGTATEQLVFTAVEGEYLIEVHGYLSSQFTLDISTGGVAGLALFAVPIGPLHPTTFKPLPSQPLTMSRPGGAAPIDQPRQYVYLPLIRR
jgi:PKD repeat protein